MTASTAGKSRPVYFKTDWETRTKRCPRCLQTKSLDDGFYMYTSGRDGQRKPGSYCRECSKRHQSRLKAMQRGANPLKRMRNRYDERGHVWCPRCRSFKHRDSFLTIRRHGVEKPASYCQQCDRILCKLRYGRTPTEKLDEVHRKRMAQKKVQRERDLRERTATVRTAIEVLLRRGFMRSEICRMVGSTHGNLAVWERGERRVGVATAQMFTAALLVTSDYQIGPYRTRFKERRTPHPDIERILDRIQDETENVRRKGHDKRMAKKELNRD